MIKFTERIKDLEHKLNSLQVNYNEEVKSQIDEKLQKIKELEKKFSEQKKHEEELGEMITQLQEKLRKLSEDIKDLQEIDAGKSKKLAGLEAQMRDFITIMECKI